MEPVCDLEAAAFALWWPELHTQTLFREPIVFRGNRARTDFEAYPMTALQSSVRVYVTSLIMQ